MADRFAYPGWLREALTREGCRLHAYVLMTNHVHLFRNTLDQQPLVDLRLALNQDQPIGNDRFYREVEAMTGQRRELRKRGRPRKREEQQPVTDPRQSDLPL